MGVMDVRWTLCASLGVTQTFTRAISDVKNDPATVIVLNSGTRTGGKSATTQPLSIQIYGPVVNNPAISDYYIRPD